MSSLPWCFDSEAENEFECLGSILSALNSRHDALFQPFFTNSPFSPFCIFAHKELVYLFINGNNAKESAGNLLCPFGGPFESCCFWWPERALKIQHELPFCISEPYYSIHYSVPFQRSRLGHVSLCARAGCTRR